METELDDLQQRRERIAEHEAAKRERADRQARLSLLTRVLLTLVNATLEQKKTLFSLLDVDATMTQNGLEIEGILREDLPRILDVDERATE